MLFLFTPLCQRSDGCADSFVGLAIFDPKKSERCGDPIPEYEGIEVSESGEIKWNYKPIGLKALSKKLANFPKDKPLEITLSKKAPLKQVQILLNFLEKNKIENVLFLK